METPQVALDFDKTDELSRSVLHALAGQTVTYGMVACALALSRLANIDKVLEDDAEIKWVGDVMDFTRAYFNEGGMS